jgi:hypothetical protein
MKDILKKITDIATIAFPALIAILGVCKLTGAIQIAETVEQVAYIVLGAATAIASVLYNNISAAIKAEELDAET